MKIRGIILAGGLSSRMGENKLELKIDGKTIIDKVIENVKSSKLQDVVVVWGKYEVDTDLPKRFNANYEEGMSTSIIEGMKDYIGDGVMVILGDMPFIEGNIINKLVSTFESSKKNIIIPRYEGKKGNPVIIGSLYFEALLKNKGDKGARDIIKENPGDIEWVDVDNNSILIDIDDDTTYRNILEV